MRTIFLIVVGLIIGITAGFYVNSESAPAPLRKTFNPQPKMEVWGFQPFWLLEQADTNYENYSSTLVYFGLQLDDEGHIKKIVNKVETEPGWNNLKTNTVRDLLSKAKKNNVLLSLAVQNANEESIAQMIEDPEVSAINLVSDVEPIMKELGFTDLNLDIESFVDLSVEKQSAFTQFVAKVRSEMTKRELGTLSIDVTPLSLIRTRLTSVKDLSAYVDRIIVMAYDYHYIGSPVAGPVAPLNGGKEVREIDVEITVKEALKQAPPEKLMLGIPTYGYEWDSLSDTPGAPVIPGTGKTASATRIEKVLRECSNCKKGRDEFSKQPYIIVKEGNVYRQIFYVDAESVKHALELVQKYALGGAAIWAYGYETSSIRDELSVYR